MKVLLLLLCLSTPVAAQEWPLSQQHTAAVVSDWLVAGQIGVDTVHSLLSENKKQALGCQAFRVGLTVAAAEATKRLVHRQRPDGSDFNSFYSEHSAIAMVSSGWRFQYSVAIGTGYLRVAAHKHYISDVLTGFGAGYLARRVCR